MATCGRCGGAGSVPESATRTCGGCGGTGKAYGYGQTCMNCGGSGQQSYERRAICGGCAGTGQVPDPRPVMGPSPSGGNRRIPRGRIPIPKPALPRTPVEEGAGLFAFAAAGFTAWADYQNPIAVEWWGHLLLIVGVYVVCFQVLKRTPALTLGMMKIVKWLFYLALFIGAIYVLDAMDLLPK